MSVARRTDLRDGIAIAEAAVFSRRWPSDVSGHSRAHTRANGRRRERASVRLTATPRSSSTVAIVVPGSDVELTIDICINGGGEMEFLCGFNIPESCDLAIQFHVRKLNNENFILSSPRNIRGRRRMMHAAHPGQSYMQWLHACVNHHQLRHSSDRAQSHHPQRPNVERRAFESGSDELGRQSASWNITSPTLRVLVSLVPVSCKTKTSRWNLRSTRKTR